MLFRKLCMLQDSKRSFYSLSFFNVFGLLLTMAVDSTSSTSSYKTLLDTMNDVGTELGNTLHNKETSFVVSVPSANILLGLLYAGAGGVTANELEKYFKLSNPKSHSLELFEKFISSLMIQGVSVANAVYLAENFEPKPDFRQIGENQFKVAVEKLDFSNKVESANTINSWVMNKTENLIKDLIQKVSYVDARQGCITAERTSDLENISQKRIRKPVARFISDESEAETDFEEENLQPPDKICKTREVPSQAQPPIHKRPPTIYTSTQKNERRSLGVRASYQNVKKAPENLDMDMETPMSFSLLNNDHASPRDIFYSPSPSNVEKENAAPSGVKNLQRFTNNYIGWSPESSRKSQSLEENGGRVPVDFNIYQAFHTLNRKVTTLQSCVDAQSAILKQVVAKLDAISQSKENIQEEESMNADIFPICSMEDFKEVDNNLRDSKSLKTKCVKILTMIGGSGKSMIQNMLKKILSDEVALQFSLTGRINGKAAFRETMIFKVIKQDIDENVKMILVNAIHFKAKWLNKFKSAYSRNGDFHVTESKKITVKLMEQTSYFQYSEDSHYQYLIMPYEVQNLSMVIILPKNLKTFYENPFPKFNLDTSRFETHRVQVVLPKFKIESKIDFVNFLQTYIPSVFNSKTANLTGISDEELFVSKMFQKAFIKVDEEGTEAAAATVLMMSFMSAFHQETPKPFIVDRPFYFGLTAKLESTHTLLFHGAVVEPKF